MGQAQALRERGWSRRAGRLFTSIPLAIVAFANAGTHALAAPPVAPEWAKVSKTQIDEAERAGLPVAWENALGMRFVLVPRGTFQMGSPDTELGRAKDEQLHPVVFRTPLYVQTSEVTNAQFRRFRPRHDSGEHEGVRLNGDLQPVVRVSYDDAKAFAQWLDEREPFRGYRLPTEAEWEHAARAGTGGRWHWGEDVTPVGLHANVADRAAKSKWPDWTIFETDDGHVGTAPVASFRPNPWGLHDMLGNAWEWTLDWYGGYPLQEAAHPLGSGFGSARVLRGGSWMNPPNSVRAAARASEPPSARGSAIGFRLVIVPRTDGPGWERPSAIEVSEPAEGAVVSPGSVLVRGTFSSPLPDEVVEVAGEAVTVVDGAFSTTLTFRDPGPRTIAVQSRIGGALRARLHRTVRVGAPGAAPAWARPTEAQVDEAERLGVPVAFENSVGMRFVLVPAGTFAKGSQRVERGRFPSEDLVPTRIARPLYVQTTETTNAQFRKFRAAHDSGGEAGHSFAADEQPAVKVSSEDARAFLYWLGKQEPGRLYRLPTDAEWEYVARAGAPGRWFHGEALEGLARHANVADRKAKETFPAWKGPVHDVDDGHAVAAPVGSYAPNAWGLHDVLGNVWEWTSAWFFGAATEEAQGSLHPPPHGSPRTIRGGAWNTPPDLLRLAYVGRAEETKGSPVIGFRVVMPLPEEDVEGWEAQPVLRLFEPAEGTKVEPGRVVRVRGRLLSRRADDVVTVAGKPVDASTGEFRSTVVFSSLGTQRLEVALEAPAPRHRTLVRTLEVVAPSGNAPAWASAISQAQVDEATRLGVPVAVENDLGMRFVLVPPGEFIMGAPAQEKDRTSDEAAHRVRLTRAYYLQVTEVTNAQFRKFRPDHDSGDAAKLALSGDAQPVVRVAHAHAVAFTGWLSGREAGRSYRLPTEAEWEHAARAGSSTRWPWGEDAEPLARHVNAADRKAKERWPSLAVFDHDDGHAVSAPVGSFRANDWGLFDMLGNAWEWVEDFYAPYSDRGVAVDPPPVAQGTNAVVRGGGWTSPPKEIRAAARGSLSPATRSESVGLRVVLELPRR